MGERSQTKPPDATGVDHQGKGGGAHGPQRKTENSRGRKKPLNDGKRTSGGPGRRQRKAFQPIGGRDGVRRSAQGPGPPEKTKENYPGLLHRERGGVSGGGSSEGSGKVPSPTSFVMTRTLVKTDTKNTQRAGKRRNGKRGKRSSQGGIKGAREIRSREFKHKGRGGERKDNRTNEDTDNAIMGGRKKSDMWLSWGRWSQTTTLKKHDRTITP